MIFLRKSNSCFLCKKISRSPNKFMKYWRLMISISIFMLCHSLVQAKPRGVKITRTEYHGWKNAIVISNGQVEAIIVPSIGRVMQFRLVGEEGVFWENSEVAGKAVNPKSNDWTNFGGDKPWPSPQSEWPKITPRSWPPPIGFDSSPWEAKEFISNITRMFSPESKGAVGATTIQLTSPVDPHFGIRVTRDIYVDVTGAAVMKIKTTFEKVSGTPVKVGVWVITQVNEAEAVFVPVPKNSPYKEGYNLQSKELPENFNVKDGLIELKRDPKKASKIGNDAGTLLWMNAKYVLRVDSPRILNADYPDNGSSAEVYTNPDPAKYIELEMQGPLQEMKVGERIERVNTYTLLRRRNQDAAKEARKILLSASN